MTTPRLSPEGSRAVRDHFAQSQATFKRMWTLPSLDQLAGATHSGHFHPSGEPRTVVETRGRPVELAPWGHMHRVGH